MDLKGTYRYLFMVRVLDSQIIKKEAKRNALVSCLLPGSMDYNTDKVQNSLGDKMTEIMADVADIDAEIRELMITKAEWIREVSEAVEHLENDSEQIILLEYYLNRKEMTAIAKQINYSVRHCYTMKRRGVKNLQQYLTELEENES